MGKRNTMNREKDKLQRETAVNIYNDENKGSLVAAATGFGKSRVPILYMKDNQDSVKKVAIIVPTRNLRDNGWKEEFSTWKAKTLYKRVETLCYASASKIKGNKYDLVILDEVHNITETSALFFEQNEVKKVIALTATVPKEQIKLDIFKNLGIQTVFKLSIDEAQEKGFVAPYKIHVIYTSLDKHTENIEVKSKKGNFFVTEQYMYNFLNKNVELAKKMGNWKLHEVNIRKRADFIYRLKSKNRAAQTILENIKGQRNLIFSGSIEQAEALNRPVYHSKSGNKGVENLRKFCLGEIDELSSVKSLNEGENIPNLDNAVIVQIASKERHLVQRIGRVCRWREGHEADIYIIVCLGTQDEVWLESALENINKDKIKYYTLDSYIYENKSKT